MHERFRTRLEAGLMRLQAATESGRLRDEAVARERLGRLKEKNWRASGMFDVTIEPLDPPVGRAHLRITWQVNGQQGEWSERSQGCYLKHDRGVLAEGPDWWKNEPPRKKRKKKKKNGLRKRTGRRQVERPERHRIAYLQIHFRSAGRAGRSQSSS